VRRFNVDVAQAERVARTSASLLEQCAGSWQLGSQLAANLVEWGSRLHEIGLDISHNGFQRHGAYIVANADLPGFPRSEQAVLAFIIASQRGSIDWRELQASPSAWHAAALRLSIIHRLAVLLNRSRSTRDLPAIRFSVSGDSAGLQFPADWLAANPLTFADLRREKNYLANIGVDLAFA